MWMCETCIVIDRRNADGNSLSDLVAALKHAGASIEEIDEERHVIYALVSASDLATIRLMDGVSYVRVVHHYHADRRLLAHGEQPVSAAG
jgi:hypothetical protein